MIVVIDYGVGNLGSILNMLKKVGVSASSSADPEVVCSASKLILPGVGAFDAGMAQLRESGLVDLLNQLVLSEKKLILGVCLGMQLLTNGSEEGKMPGLGWIDAQTQRFSFDTKSTGLTIPHMGWNRIKVHQKETLLESLPEDSRFYFVHSYHVVCNNPSDVLATSFHGYTFTSAVRRENIMGTQFHPEKSHKFGMELLKNFAKM